MAFSSVGTFFNTAVSVNDFSPQFKSTANAGALNDKVRSAQSALIERCAVEVYLTELCQLEHVRLLVCI